MNPTVHPSPLAAAACVCLALACTPTSKPANTEQAPAPVEPATPVEPPTAVEPPTPVEPAASPPDAVVPEQRLFADVALHDGLGFDVEDLSESEWDRLSELADVEAPAADDPRIPARYRPGTPFVVVGVAGRLDAEIAALEIDEADVEVRLEPSCPPQDASEADDPIACAKRILGSEAALIFRPGDVPDGLRVHPVEPAAKPLRAAIEANIRARVDAALGEGPKPKPSELRVTTTRAKLPDAGVAFVSVSVEGTDDDDDDDDPWGDPRLTGFGVADASGSIIRWLTPLEAPTDTYVHRRVEAVFDLDGDGLDEVLVSRTIFEGFYVDLMRPADDYATQLLEARNP